VLKNTRRQTRRGTALVQSLFRFKQTEKGTQLVTCVESTTKSISAQGLLHDTKCSKQEFSGKLGKNKQAKAK